MYTNSYGERYLTPMYTECVIMEVINKTDSDTFIS